MQVDVDTGGRWRGDPEGEPDGDARLIATAGIAATALFLASWVPEPFTWLVFAELMRWAAIGAALAAVLRREPLTPPHVTAWDQAALFLLLGYVGRFQVDLETVMQAASALEAGAGVAD
ncbi:MAG: hypothetical protein ACLFTG_07960 [Alphaproteobacteria bacterium]